VAEYDHPFRAGGIHHGSASSIRTSSVVDPYLEGRQPVLGDPVRQADASLVEDHDA